MAKILVKYPPIHILRICFVILLGIVFYLFEKGIELLFGGGRDCPASTLLLESQNTILNHETPGTCGGQSLQIKTEVGTGNG